MNSKTSDITNAPVTPLLLRMTFPMIFGMLGLVAFNMVDTYFVSKLGLIPMAAMTLTFPVVMVIGALAQGVGIGAASLISRAVGENNHDKVVRYTTDSLTLGLLLVLVFVIAGMLTIEPLFTLLGADAQTLPYIVDYMKIWYAGVMFLIIPMIGNAGIRALGDTKTPAVIMTVAAVVNMIFDPMLIFGFGPFPAMGIKGAALATVISRMITMIVSLYVLVYRQKIVSLKNAHLGDIMASIKDLLFIGLPNALTRIMTPLAVGIITSLVATFGTEATAGFGIATRIEMFAMLVINALASIFVPILGQNLGAKKHDRVNEIIKKSEFFSLAYGVLTLVIFFFAGGMVASLFTDNALVIETVKTYLYIIPIGYGLQGIFLIHTSALNVLNKPMHSAVIAMVRLFVLYVPIALLLSRVWGLTGIWIALNASFLIVALGSGKLIKKYVGFAFE